MRAIKLIVGLVSLLAALLFGVSACLIFWAFLNAEWPLRDMVIASGIPTVLATGFAASGRFLLTRRGSPLSKKALGWIACLWMSTTLLLVAVAVPNFIRARTTTAKNACINSLRQIDGAKQQWALENNITTNAQPSWNDILPYLGRGTNTKMPHCPHGGTYTIGRVDEPPRCSVPYDVLP
jgi:hypothetical protein